ncbi:MAG: prepilin peptidase [Acidobacteria bacterium]|nr:prepilin peptidase [Acidobacteriota bacterium]
MTESASALALTLGVLWPWAALALGLVVGSFANVCIHRLPLRQSVVTPRSRCPACGAPIRALDNVPLLSYALLRGRCRSCRAPISARYPAVEALNGLIYLAIAAAWGVTPRAVLAMAFATALLVLALVDLEHHILPDRVTLPGIALGLVGSFLSGPPHGPRPLGALAAAAGGYAAFALVAEAYLTTRGIEGLGQGDWKMAAMLGAFLGWERLLLTVFVATLSGTLVGLGLMAAKGRGLRHALPLGTFLGVAGLFVLLWGDPVVAWYKGVLRG